MRAFGWAAAIALVATGCATNLASYSVADLAKAVRPDTSDFDASVRYDGMTIIADTDAALDLAYTFVRLRSFVSKSGGARRHQLYVRRTYTSAGWVFYATAADDRAQSHPVRVIDRAVASCGSLGCEHTEHVAVDLDEAFLRDRAASGFRMRLAAANGSGAIVLDVPANYIQAQLLALGVP